MYFKDLKQNYPVYILDKQNLTLIQGKAVSVGFPRMELNPAAGKSGMVVDVSIEAGGKTANYVIPETLSVTYAGNLVLSVDRQGACRGSRIYEGICGAGARVSRAPETDSREIDWASGGTEPGIQGKAGDGATLQQN